MHIFLDKNWRHHHISVYTTVTRHNWVSYTIPPITPCPSITIPMFVAMLLNRYARKRATPPNITKGRHPIFSVPKAVIGKADTKYNNIHSFIF